MANNLKQETAKGFYFAGLIESWGRGTINMVNDCKALNIPEPQYSYQTSFFSITFLKSVNDPVNDRQRIILNLIKSNKFITREQLATGCNISIETIKRDLKKLKELNIIIRKGSDKTGCWKIRI